MQSINNFYNAAITGIRNYLMREGFVHRDSATLKQARRLGVKIKGSYEIVGGTNSPKILTVELRLQANHLGFFSDKERLSMAAGLSGEYKINIERAAESRILLQIPKPKELWYVFPIASLPLLHGSDKISIGKDTKGDVVYYDWSNPTFAHLFISGMTGSGKTWLEKSLAIQLSRQNDINRFRLMIGDVGKRGANFQDIEKSKSMLFPTLTTLDEIHRGFLWMLEQLEYRTGLNHNELHNEPRIIFLIDETQDVLNDETIAGIAKQIAAKGREFKLNLLLATQFTNLNYLGDNQIVKNMARIVGKVNNSNESFNMTGVKNAGAESLVGYGDFLMVADGNTKRFQSGLITPSILRQINNHDTDIASIDLLPVLDTTGTYSIYQTAITPEMVAVSIDTPSYRQIMQRLGVGQKVAKNIREWKDDLLKALDELGYTITKK